MEIWLPQWYPKGRGCKGYFEIGDIGGTLGDSLKICLTGSKRGLWYDFAMAEGGDIFSLWGINHDISGFGNIFKDIAGYYGINGCEVPGTKEKRGNPNRRHVYLNADGDISCYIYRYEYTDGSNEFLPWNTATGKTEFPSPRPLYRLPQLMKTNKIILVEGEKCADALVTAGFPATTLMGGANIWHRAIRYPWRLICKRYGKTSRTLIDWHNAGIDAIVKVLNNPKSRYFEANRRLLNRYLSY